MTETNDERIAREEAYWTGPKLFAFALTFLVVAIALIYVMSQLPASKAV